jgi:hypothetical protein
LIEFAFGLDPTQNSAGKLPPWEIIGSDFVVSFTGVSGITYGAEWSATLAPGSWLEISNSSTLSQYKFTAPIGTNTKMFMRLKVTSP